MFAVDLPGGDREFTETQIADQLSKGKIGPDTLVWRDGMSEWLEIRKVPDLARYLKKSTAAETPSPAKAAIATKPAAAAAPTAAGRFRPRQPTLPMGMLPDAIQATLPQIRPVEAAATPVPAPAAQPAPGALPPPPAAASPPAPSAAPAPTPLPRLPAPASRAATIDTREGPAGFAARERAAALLKPPPERKETPRVGSVRAQLPVVPMPEQMSDEDPTILRASPFDALEATPAPRAPLPTPVRDLLARQGQGDQASAPRAAPERKPPAPAPSPPQPPSRPQPPPSAPPSPAPRIDTFRATPEAKRSWFPEPGSQPPPPPAPPAASAPFPVGAPRAVPPSAPFAAPMQSGPFGSPMPSSAYGAPPPIAAPTAPLTFDEVEALRGKKKKTLWIVIAVVVLLVIGGALALSGGSEKLPLPAPTPEPHAALPSPAPTATTTTAQPSSGSNSPESEPVRAAPNSATLPGAPTPNGGDGFAQMFAQGAKQAGGPGAGSGHFDPGVAKAALDALLGEAARCREPGGPQGITRVAVTFAPNGGVSSATIAEPPFAGSSVGNCICEAMKRARIKPFSGPPGNLTERISIR